MRLVDVDALDYALGASDEDIYFHHMLEDAPTIDAIPVEWLKACGKRGSIIWVIADILIERWQKEQGART